MSTGDRTTAELEIAELLGELEGPDAASPEDRVQIEAAFRALDDLVEPEWPAMQRTAMRDLLLLEVAPDLSDERVQTGGQALDGLVDPVMKTGAKERIRRAIARGISSTLDWRDELLWSVGAVAVASVGTAWLGLRPAAATGDVATLFIPASYFVLSAIAGLVLLHRRGPGAATGTIAIALALLGGLPLLLATGTTSTGSSLALQAQNLECLAVGSLSALAVAFPLIVRHRGLPIREAAWLGGFGALVGGAVLHAHCPLTHSFHVAVFHPGALVPSVGLVVLVSAGATGIRRAIRTRQ